MANELKAYLTVAPENVGESFYEDRKSQFFGFAVHAKSAEQAIAFRHEIIEKIPTASHYVSAWMLADGAEFFSDAKEPHGAAGLPVLNAIKGRDLRDTACVVARIFGGTLLGKGGLMRAYTKAASDALDAAHIAQRTPCQLARIVVPYQLYEALRHRLPEWQARIDDTSFAELVTLAVSTPSENAPNLEKQIRDFTNGRIQYERCGEELRFFA